MKVLVTGASGMLGRGVAGALLERGDDVVVLQRRPSGVPTDEVLASVTDPGPVRAAAAGCDAVVHLAARVSVTGRWRDFAATNIAGTANVLGAARAAGTGSVVHVSSPSVAHAGHALVGEGAGPADPARARGHYSRSKAVAELLALDADGPDMAVVAIRPHLVWGPGDTQLVGRIAQRAQAGRLALVDRGAALIDTTYVDNAVGAILAALDHARPTDPVHGRALVVSNGEPRTVAELVARICEAVGAPPPGRRVPFGAAWAGGAVVEALWSGLRRSDDPPMTRFLAEQLSTAHWFDQRETRRLLGWEPTIDLDEGFRRLAADARPQTPSAGRSRPQRS